MDLVEWAHRLIDRRRVDEAFPLIAALENQRRLNLEELSERTGYHESRAQKSLDFLLKEELVEVNDQGRYLLTGYGYRLFNRKIAAPVPMGPGHQPDPPLHP